MLFGNARRRTRENPDRDPGRADEAHLRTDETHNQILRRLHTLDDLYGFIRTHIFWVRDQEPIGLATLQQAEHEAFLVEQVGSSPWPSTRSTPLFGADTRPSFWASS